MTPEEWLAKKAKEFARQQVLSIADKLSDNPQQPAITEESSPPVPTAGRMGEIDGKDVPELLAVSALEVPENSPDSEFILRGLPDFGKELLKLDPEAFAFKEEPPPELKPLPPPPAPLPSPPAVKPELKKKDGQAVVTAAVVVGGIIVGAYNLLSQPKREESRSAAAPNQTSRQAQEAMPATLPAPTPQPAPRIARVEPAAPLPQLPVPEAAAPPPAPVPANPAATKPRQSFTIPFFAVANGEKFLVPTLDDFVSEMRKVASSPSLASEAFGRKILEDAMADDPDAEYLVGGYFLRKGAETDAAPWIRSAARHGNVKAQAWLDQQARASPKPAPVQSATVIPQTKPADTLPPSAAPADARTLAALGNKSLKEKNYQEAAKWLRIAADQGNAEAQESLGALYEQGLGGLPKDPQEAVRWYLMAANHGFARAQFDIGSMYKYGQGGLPHDEREAAKWFRLAADQGDRRAQYFLGDMYENGYGGLPKDLGKAVTLFRKAAAQGDALAQARADNLNTQIDKDKASGGTVIENIDLSGNRITNLR